MPADNPPDGLLIPSPARWRRAAGLLHWPSWRAIPWRARRPILERRSPLEAVLERLGFVIEGRADAYLRINGVWEEHILTAKTNVEWRPSS